MRFDPSTFRAHKDFRSAVEAQDRGEDFTQRHASYAGASHEDIQSVNSKSAKAIAADDVRFEAEAAKLRAELDAWGV